jgi:hypothetical protein
MTFRECINCEYLSCTLHRSCVIDNQNNDTPDFPALEADDAPCNARHSHNGMCPCCGVELEPSEDVLPEGQFVDVCPSCGWESDISYDY